MKRSRTAAAVTVIGMLSIAGCAAWAAATLTGGVPAATRVRCGESLSAIRPAPGSRIELQRGCRYAGPLKISADGVTVAAYGTGADPMVTVKENGAAVKLAGSGAMIEDLSLAGVAQGTWHCGGRQTPAGHADGVDIARGSHDDTITNISATGFYAGVYVMAGSTGNIIANSIFTGNAELDTNNSHGSAGAFGVLLWGNDNTVQDNIITGSQACSIAYGYDGSAVEIYGGSRNLVENNRAANNNAFTELGSYPGATATGNMYRGNVVSDGQPGRTTTFLITRGSADPNGPVNNTIVAGNTVTLTRPGDQGAISYGWRATEGTLLTLTGNYLNLGGNAALYEDGGYVNGGGNNFTGTCYPSSGCS